MKLLRFENPKLHFLIWFIFVAYEIVIGSAISGVKANFWDNLGHYALNISIFYFNAHLVLQYTDTIKDPSYVRIPARILGLLASLAVYVCIRYWLQILYNSLHIPTYPPFKDYNTTINQAIYRGVYFIGLSTGYWFAMKAIQNRRQIAELETLQLKTALQTQALEKTLLTTENAYLKSQINPHFLLNTLNFLYNSVSKLSESVADSVMTLAEIMRYALTNADEDGKVRLELEIDHINNFIKLNQARFSKRLCIDLEVKGDADGLRIIPLVLITLAENVFKYGDLLDENHPAKILAHINGQSLTFITQNRKKKKPTAPGHGIGIQNIKSRLAMYHPYELIIEDEEQEYRSILKIQL